MHETISIAIIVELILALGAVAEGALIWHKAKLRDDEQEKAIANIQQFLNSTHNFVPRKWYKE